MKRFLLIILLVIILGVAGCIAYWLFIDDVRMKPTIVEETIDFKEIGKTIHVRAISWGVSGNHNEVVFSDKPFSSNFREYNSEDLIFHTGSLFYKKKDSVHLVIYVQSSAVGDTLNSELGGVKIILKEINTFDEIKQLNENYQELRLKKISI